jgi:hypothetical protein
MVIKSLVRKRIVKRWSSSGQLKIVDHYLQALVLVTCRGKGGQVVKVVNFSNTFLLEKKTYHLFFSTHKVFSKIVDHLTTKNAVSLGTRDLQGGGQLKIVDHYLTT